MLEAELVQKLIEGDEEFKRMYAEHRELDIMISELEESTSHSDRRATEIKRLKKRKLALKDRMETIKKRVMESV